jgi:hypothetical protein
MAANSSGTAVAKKTECVDYRASQRSNVTRGQTISGVETTSRPYAYQGQSSTECFQSGMLNTGAGLEELSNARGSPIEVVA